MSYIASLTPGLWRRHIADLRARHQSVWPFRARIWEENQARSQFPNGRRVIRLLSLSLNEGWRKMTVL
jgi:hypothetical protein